MNHMPNGLLNAPLQWKKIEWKSSLAKKIKGKTSLAGPMFLLFDAPNYSH